MLPVDPDHSRWSADQRCGLGDLVLVVREDVVDAAGVHVEPVAEVAPRHRRALEVPTREPLAPALRGPFQRSARPSSLPEGEVGWVALVGLDLTAVPGSEAIQRIP